MKKYDKNREDEITMEEFRQIMSEFDVNKPGYLMPNDHYFDEEQRLVLCPDPKVVDFIR